MFLFEWGPLNSYRTLHVARSEPGLCQPELGLEDAVLGGSGSKISPHLGIEQFSSRAKSVGTLL